MTPNCSQSLSNGQSCSAPAVSGSKFCRHHDPQRPPRPVEEKSPETEPLILPQILDKQSALAAVNQVLQALSEDRIKRSVAQTLLSAIKFAARLIEEIAAAGETVGSGFSRPTTVALAAASSPRRALDPVTTKHPRYPYPVDIDSPAAQIVKELMGQSREFAKVQKGALNPL